MRQRTALAMRRYWDAMARSNAAWYVDTSLAYDAPDMQRFLEAGEAIVADALDGAPAPDRFDTALEVGCGLGRVAVALRKRFDNVLAVDVSAEMLERAREVVDDPQVRFIHGDGVSLDGVEDQSVDLVISFTVFQHIPSAGVIEGYLLEAGRVLRPGGVLVFQWNNQPGPRRWVVRRWWLGLLQRTGLRPERYRRNAPQFLGSRVPLGRIDGALERAGLVRMAVRNPGTLYAWAWARRT